MKREIFKYISKNISKNPLVIDRLLVSAFIKKNKIKVENNDLIKSYIIGNTNNKEESRLKYFLDELEKLKISLDLEELIELFEFVVSPSEKIVTGAVYTPKYIREYIILNTITQPEQKDIRIADIACGCSGFLLSAAIHLKHTTNKSYEAIISDNLFGLDIAEYSIIRSKIILALLALSHGEDKNFSFNLFVGNSLDYDWKQNCEVIRKNNGFDYILGNPPYVCSRNIDTVSRKLLENWEVTKSGHPDLYIPFFQIGMDNLNPSGCLGYITVNTFFKSINGRDLRSYFSKNSFQFSIIDFRNEQVFYKRNTYTCICLIRKSKSEFINYLQTESANLSKIKADSFSRIKYSSLDNFNGWNMGSANDMATIIKIESLKDKIFSKFTFSTGIATLKNSLYKFRYHKKDATYFYIKNDDTLIKIERKICREIINSNRVTTVAKLDSIKEHVIFPYKWNPEFKKYTVISEDEFIRLYPSTYAYLFNNQKDLAKRDKGKGKYEAWYAYGRNQSLDVRGIKLFFPHITNNPSFVLCSDNKLLFYNGEAIISEDEFELRVLKKILESPIFWFYITTTSKPYASQYYSLGKNYMKQFSIPELTMKEKQSFLKANKMESLNFLLKKYGLTKNDISK